MRDVSELMAEIKTLPEAQQVQLLQELDKQLAKREDNPTKVDPPDDSILGKPRVWTPIQDILKVILLAQNSGWMWYWNTRCKYVELRIDMRDQCALIRDREGKLISLEQLQYQYSR